MAGAGHDNPMFSFALGSTHPFFSIGDGHQPNSGGLYTQEYLYIYGCTSTIGLFAEKNSPIFQASFTNLEDVMQHAWIDMDDSGIV